MANEAILELVEPQQDVLLSFTRIFHFYTIYFYKNVIFRCKKKMKKKFWPKVDCSTEKFFHMFDICLIFLQIVHIFKISKQFSMDKKSKK